MSAFRHFIFTLALAVSFVFAVVSPVGAWTTEQRQGWTSMLGWTADPQMAFILVGNMTQVEAGYQRALERRDYMNWVYHPSEGVGDGPQKVSEVVESMYNARRAGETERYFELVGELAFYMSSLANPLNTAGSDAERAFFERYQRGFQDLTPNELYGIAREIRVTLPHADMISAVTEARNLAERANLDYTAITEAYIQTLDTSPDTLLTATYQRAATNYLESTLPLIWATWRHPFTKRTPPANLVVDTSLEKAYAELRGLSDARVEKEQTPLEVASDSARQLGLYQVMVNDQIRISIWKWYDQSVKVGPDGTVSLPFIGLMHVQGFTVPELEVILKDKVKEKVLQQWNLRASTNYEPVVNVSLLSYNPNILRTPVEDVPIVQQPRAFVVGEVQRPGQYPAWNIAELISQARGFKTTADQQKVTLVRGGKQYNLDLESFFKRANLLMNVALRDGDILIVKEKWTDNLFTKYQSFMRFFNIFFDLETKSVGPIIK